MLVICFLGLYVAPRLLGTLAKGKLQEAKAQFAECGDGTPLLRSAEKYLSVQRAIPLWSTHARVSRLKLYDAVGKLYNCEDEVSVSTAVAALSYLNGRPTLNKYFDRASFLEMRGHIEERWMNFGNLEAIVELARQRPGAQTKFRVKAHLLLGQLDQAAKPHHPMGSDKSNAALLCLTGDTEAALERFARDKNRFLPHEYATRHSDFVVTYAECLIRAQKYDELELLLAQYADESEMSSPTPYYGVQLAMRRGDQAKAYELVLSSDFWFQDSPLFRLVAARQGDWTRAALHVSLHNLDRPHFYSPAINDEWSKALLEELENAPEKHKDETRSLACYLNLGIGMSLAAYWDPKAELYFERGEACPATEYFEPKKWRKLAAFRQGKWAKAGLTIDSPEIFEKFGRPGGFEEPTSEETNQTLQERYRQNFEKWREYLYDSYQYPSIGLIGDVIVLGTLLDEDVSKEREMLAVYRKLGKDQPNQVLLPWIERY